MKFKVFHMKRIIATFVVAIVVLAATGIEVLMQNMLTQTTSALPLEGKTVVVDPGHGGIDKGASDNGAIEKEINLAVANFLKEYIEAGGGKVYMTRNTDTNTADPDRDKSVSQKKSDLQMRKSDIEKYKADIFISIHMNKFEQSKYRGAQVFYDNDSQENRLLAEAIQKSVKDVLKDGNTRVAKSTGDSIFVLRDNSVPSALIECGFLSNPEEAKLLQTAEYQKSVAEGIYTGIVKYFKAEGSRANKT